MRIILILWALPIIFFWGWYGLSFNDINFGVLFLSREFHDHMFAIYGNILQMPAEEIPAKIAWVFFIDSLFLLSIAVFRWRAKWYPQTKVFVVEWFASFRKSFIQEEDTELKPDEAAFQPVSIPAANGQVHPAE